MKKIIGRSFECDYQIIDPNKKVSRLHAEIQLIEENQFIILDLNSTNGTYVNGHRIPPQTRVNIKSNDQVTLSKSYRIDPSSVFNSTYNQEDKTVILGAGHTNQIKQVVLDFDKEKTQITQLSVMDERPFIAIGRDVSNPITINQPKVSKFHCKIRQLGLYIFEIMDEGSTNGTFVDGIKLEPRVVKQFSSSATVKLANEIQLNLKKILPGLEIIKKTPPKPIVPTQQQLQNKTITPDELNAFNELEEVWAEFSERQKNAANSTSSYLIGGQLLGGIASFVLGGGPIGMALSIGGGIVARYLGQQKTNELRGDSNYENMFLQIYCCPRCEESFQKKPWITIRDCPKCKLKFR
jgi:pSer/pThr/pTyr-binding forkhead associated (FHA) protein